MFVEETAASNNSHEPQTCSPHPMQQQLLQQQQLQQQQQRQQQVDIQCLSSGFLTSPTLQATNPKPYKTKP